MAKKVIALDVDIKTTTVGEAVKKTQSLKSELRQLKQELQTMDESAPQFLEIAKKAGEIEDRIKATNEQVAAFAGPANERALQGIVGVANGIAGGFAAVQGATALFVGENEDLQKVLVKTQAAMSVLNGLTAIQETLKRESAASTLRYTTATKAATIATRIFSVATSFLGKALIATGIGAIVVALGMLIANFDKLKDVMTTAASKARDFAKESKEISDQSVKNAESFDEEARTLRRLGFEEDEVEKKRKERRLQALKDLENTQKANESLVVASEQNLKKVQEWEKWGFGLIPRLLFGDEGDIENAKESVKETSKQIEKLQNDIFETEKKIEEDKKKKAEETRKEEERKRKEAVDKRKAAEEKEEMERQKAQAIKDAADRKDQERLIATMKEGYDKELALLKFKHEQELKEAIKNGENETLLKRLQKDQLFDLELKYSEKVKENDIKTNEAQIKQLDDFFAAQQRRNEARMMLEQQLTDNSINLLGQLAAVSKDNSNLQKGLVLAQIAADTAAAISSLVRNSQANPANAATSGIAGAVQFTAGLAQILSGVAQAKRVLQGGGGGAAGGGGGGQQPQLSRSQPPQSFGLDTRAFNQQGDTRVYVVENDITRSQRRVAQLRESAIID
jgi:hypothetical protein